MTRPRFRFTIRGLLGATFWVAVGAAAWSYDVDGARPPVQAAIRLLQGVSPVTAFAALFGQTPWGLLIGTIVGFGWLNFMSLASIIGK